MTLNEIDFEIRVMRAIDPKKLRGRFIRAINKKPSGISLGLVFSVNNKHDKIGIIVAIDLESFYAGIVCSVHNENLCHLCPSSSSFNEKARQVTQSEELD